MTTTTTALSPAPPSTGLSSAATQLRIACALTIGFAVMISLGSHESTDGLLRWFADLLFWPLGDGTVLTEEARLIAAILGGIMAGFGVIFWLLTNELAASNPALLKRLVLITMGVWFVIDGIGSVASGGWRNLIGNIGYLAMFVIPAMRLR